MTTRVLTFRIFRHNPQDPESVPHFQEYRFQETPGLNLYMVLNRIREEQDPSLIFDFVCRAGVCGSCAMMVNGRPRLGCQTLTRDLPDTIELRPLPVFDLVGDLSVDTGTWFREKNALLQTWIHTEKKFDPKAEEMRLENDKILEIYELDRCIECGCCIASCGTANMREDFVGPSGQLRVVRYLVDPRDERKPDAFLGVMANDEGIYGCLGLHACEDVCPKEIPLLNQFATLRRKMLWATLFGAKTSA